MGSWRRSPGTPPGAVLPGPSDLDPDALEWAYTALAHPRGASAALDDAMEEELSDVYGRDFWEREDAAWRSRAERRAVARAEETRAQRAAPRTPAQKATDTTDRWRDLLPPEPTF